MNHYLSVSVICLLTMIPGCGGGPDDAPELGDVSGTVKVGFQPEEGRPSTGTTDDSGYYELTYSMSENGAKIGKGVMTITSPRPEAAGCCGGGCGDTEFVDPIPPQYNLNATNNPEMNKEVKAGDNTFDFDIDTSIREEVPQSDCGGRSYNCCCG
jgi:hypothetical protein